MTSVHRPEPEAIGRPRTEPRTATGARSPGEKPLSGARTGRSRRCAADRSGAESKENSFLENKGKTCLFHFVPSSFLLLVAMPGAPNVASLLLAAMPRAPSSFLFLVNESVHLVVTSSRNFVARPPTPKTCLKTELLGHLIEERSQLSQLLGRELLKPRRLKGWRKAPRFVSR